jgi:hypothetical protein
MRGLLIGAFAAGLSAMWITAAASQTSDDETVLALEQTLWSAIRGSDAAGARRLIARAFTYVDETGAIHARRDLMHDLNSAAAGAARDVTAKVYGRVAAVTGTRTSARNAPVFFVDIWVKRRRGWEALIAQDNEIAPPGAAAPPPSAGRAEIADDDCQNPCQAVPYRPRSPAERDIVVAFQAIEKAGIDHDADEWARHVAEEFFLARTKAPIKTKADRVAVIKGQKAANTPVAVATVETMRLWVFGDAAVMAATHAMPDHSRPPYRALRVWIKRDGRWQMAISQQTDIAK